MKAVETTALSKKYKDTLAVDSLDLTVEEGELIGLLGVNGAGKTTTVKMLSGLCRPTSGDAYIFGKSINTQLEQVKECVNISPQETAIARNLTVWENLLFAAGIYGIPHTECIARAREVSAELSLEEVTRKKARTLSGGYQRRLSIAMALITRPRLLFLDEPTLGLDVLARRELWNVINTLKANMTIILTTHYMEEAESLADRVAVMAHGRLLAYSTPAELVAGTGAKNFEDAFIAIAGDKAAAVK